MSSKSKSTISEVVLVSLYPGEMKVTGKSGRNYYFARSGAEVKVLKEDIEILLGKSQRSCCGGQPTRFFTLVSID